MDLDWDMLHYAPEATAPIKSKPAGRAGQKQKPATLEAKPKNTNRLGLAKVLIDKKAHEDFPMVPKDLQDNLAELPAQARVWIGQTWLECRSGKLGCIACAKVCEEQRTPTYA